LNKNKKILEGIKTMKTQLCSRNIHDAGSLNEDIICLITLIKRYRKIRYVENNISSYFDPYRSGNNEQHPILKDDIVHINGFHPNQNVPL